jgi:hypothetical protein
MMNARSNLGYPRKDDEGEAPIVTFNQLMVRVAKGKTLCDLECFGSEGVVYLNDSWEHELLMRLF